MTNVTEILRANLHSIQQNARSACARVGRGSDDVRIIAVTKSARIEWIHELVALGQRDLAENRPQQLLERAAQFNEPVEWHQIGTLQRNKVRKVLPVVGWIHSVDTLSLLLDVDRIAGELRLQPKILLQVNVSGERSKQGFEPETLESSLADILELTHVDIRGMMTMAPLVENAEDVRFVFRQLREFRDRIVEASHGRLNLGELSMGMSGDFKVAIEEGATMIRIGSALFAGLEDTANDQ